MYLLVYSQVNLLCTNKDYYGDTSSVEKGSEGRVVQRVIYCHVCFYIPDRSNLHVV